MDKKTSTHKTENQSSDSKWADLLAMQGSGERENTKGAKANEYVGAFSSFLSYAVVAG